MQVWVFLGQPPELGTSANRTTLAPAEILISAEVIRGFFFLPWRSFRDGVRGMETLVPSCFQERKALRVEVAGGDREVVSSERRGQGSRGHLYLSYGFRRDQTSPSVRRFTEQQNLLAYPLPAAVWFNELLLVSNQISPGL